MIRRSWHSLAIGNALVAIGSVIGAIVATDHAIRWLMIGNAIGSGLVAAWALRKDDGHVDEI